MEKSAGVPASTAAIITLPSYPQTLEPSSIQRIAGLMWSFSMLAHIFGAGRMLH